MYVPHFGLTQEPFSIAPDPRFLYMSERHREALAHLLYGLGAGGGFVLLSGEIGAGKTTVCRCFLEQVPATCHVAYIFNPKLTVIELMQTVCVEFGLPDTSAGAPTVKTCVDALNAFLLAAHAAGETCVLIIDEAQNLSPEVLEQLRLLTNLETTQRKLLQIVLIGQPELRQLVARPEMEQLAQRVIARYHLQALGQDETVRYVRHRLGVAGLTGALPFDDAALRRIHRLSGGVPRRINLLCDRALLGAYGEGRQRVDRRTVDAAAREVFDRQPRHAQRSWLSAALGASAVLGLGAVLATVLRAPAPAAIGLPASAALAASSASAVAAAVPAASLTAPPASSVPALLASLDDLRQRQPWRDEAEAWRMLARRWQIDVASADPCQTVETLGLSCYRGQNTLATLRQLDRPLLLALDETAGQGAGWALLTALDADAASLVLADGDARVALAVLGARWRGEFATLWRRPPGDRDQQAAWVLERLQRVQGAALPSQSTLRQRVEAFQVAQGLKPDGLAGPMTMMQLNRATAEPEPRLDRE